MGWQATGDSRTDGQSGQDHGLPELLAGFDHGGPWAEAAPSAALAAALERAAGPADLYEGAETDALTGIARQWAAVESWAAAGKLAALRAMTREDSGGRPLLRRRPGMPEGWDDSLTYEISGALAMGPVSAGNLASLAWTLVTRLAGIGRLLADGTLTMSKAKLVAATFEPLDEREAARAEALVLGELAGKTYFQVERLAWRAALAVAPDVAERRRSRAEQEHARVTVFREESGAMGLSGRDLPAAQALSGHANVVARAGQYQASGVFSGQAASSLEALAYVDLLNGISVQERIAFATSAAAQPPDGPRPDDGPTPDDSDGDGTGPGDGGGSPDPSSGPGPEAANPGDSGHGLDELADPEVPASPLVEVAVPLATLPGGQQLAVRFEVVPTHACDHRYRVSSYLPGERLRRLVQVRDHECTWPPCSRPAHDSDFEHAIPYDQGGATDACNAGARSRRCHQVKQMPGWTVTQPKPGWHVWTTPTGRIYVQEPWRYTA